MWKVLVFLVVVGGYLMNPIPTYADGHLTPSQPIVEPVGTLCPEGGAFCRLVFISLIGFALVEWLTPLNDPNADPLRCRGQASVIKAPPPQGTALCQPLPG